MVINANSPAADASLNSTQAAAAKSNRNLRSGSSTAPDDGASTASVTTGIDSPADSGIQDANAAQQSVASARDNILLHSSSALLAQANLNPETVFQLLQT